MSYLQKAWTDPIEQPTRNDIQEAIKEIQTMDDEHGVFWVGTDEEELILETHKDLSVFLSINGENAIRSKFHNWEQAFQLYEILLTGELDKVRENFPSIS